MSFVESLKTRFGGDRPAKLVLTDALREAEQEVTRLEAERGTYALALAQGAENAAETMRAWRHNLAEAESNVADLKAASEAAREQERQAERAAVAKTRQSHIRALQQKLGEQQRHLIRLAAAIDNISLEWFEVQNLARDIEFIMDAAGIEKLSWVPFALPHALRHLAELELWRVNRTPPGNARTFPASIFSVSHTEQQRRDFAITHGWSDAAVGGAEATKPMAARLDELRARFNEHLTGAPLPARMIGDGTIERPASKPPASATSNGPIPISDFVFPPDAPHVEAAPGADGLMALPAMNTMPPVDPARAAAADAEAAERMKMVNEAFAHAATQEK